MTLSKVVYVLAYISQPCFRARLGGGMACFGAPALLLVLLLLILVVLHHHAKKSNSLASTGSIDPIQSLLCIGTYQATMV